MTNILFICKSDRIAAKMAAAYLSHRLEELGCKEVETFSAGTSVRRGDGIPEVAVNFLKSIGCTVPLLMSTQLTLKEIRNADLIVCLSEETFVRVSDGYKSAKYKTINLMAKFGGGEDVFEPRSTLESCRNCMAMMKSSLDNMAERLK